MKTFGGFLPVSVLICGASLLPSMCLATATFQLTDSPDKPTLRSCQTWAAAQDPDAIYAWGMTKEGQTLRQVALSRLTLSCLGDERPDIVLFGSSAGFNSMFCKQPRYSGSKLCIQFEKDCFRHKEACE